MHEEAIYLQIDLTPNQVAKWRFWVVRCFKIFHAFRALLGLRCFQCSNAPRPVVIAIETICFSLSYLEMGDRTVEVSDRCSIETSDDKTVWRTEYDRIWSLWYQRLARPGAIRPNNSGILDRRLLSSWSQFHHESSLSVRVSRNVYSGKIAYILGLVPVNAFVGIDYSGRMIAICECSAYINGMMSSAFIFTLSLGLMEFIHSCPRFLFAIFSFVIIK